MTYTLKDYYKIYSNLLLLHIYDSYRNCRFFYFLQLFRGLKISLPLQIFFSVNVFCINFIDNALSYMEKFVHLVRTCFFAHRWGNVSGATSVIDEEIIELRASERKWPPFVLGSVGPSLHDNQLLIRCTPAFPISP